MREKCCYDKFSMKICFQEEKMRTRENKRMVKHQFFFQDFPFLAYAKKINTLIFWCMIIPLGLHSVYN